MGKPFSWKLPHELVLELVGARSVPTALSGADEFVVEGTRVGYEFEVANRHLRPNQAARHYKRTAVPLEPGKSGVPAFAVRRGTTKEALWPTVGLHEAYSSYVQMPSSYVQPSLSSWQCISCLSAALWFERAEAAKIGPVAIWFEAGGVECCEGFYLPSIPCSTKMRPIPRVWRFLCDGPGG
jgi:hypothetical protein